MKQFYLLFFVLLLILSCKKEIKNAGGGTASAAGYIESVRATLKDSLSAEDYSNLDFERAALNAVDSIQFYCLRIPFKGKELKNDFIIVKIKIDGSVERGKIIHLDGGAADVPNGKMGRKAWNGSISISSFDRKDVLKSAIVNGYISALHQGLNEKTSVAAPPVYPSPYVALPEVVVVAYIHSGGISYSDWEELVSLYDSYGGGGSGSAGASGSGDLSGYYGPVSGGGGTVGSTGSSTGGVKGSGSPGGVQTSPTIKVDYDNQYANPAIDLNAYLKCFTNIPDAGASCSIEILTDIPVDGDPTKFFDWSNGSPGHTFLQLRKVNGTQTAMENIGFYPKSGWKTVLTPAPIDGKFVDNSGHEYNASLKININTAQFQNAINEMLYLGKFVKYDIDEYNCTDWALEVFNTARNSANQLVIPKFDLPYGEAPNGSSTPQGLYLKLQQMKKDNGPEAANIDMGFIKGFVASSTGPCN